MKSDVRSYQKGHPNPLFYRENWESLNGNWSFVFDDENRGLQEGWSRQAPDKTLTINVPYAYETPASGINSQQEHQILWYFKKFPNPHYDGKTMLHVERCDYVFDGWVNGHYLGKHIGGYDAFRYDISEFLVDGDNFLSIRVYDDKDPSHVRGKQTWKDKPFACFYPTTSGLYGDVWLEDVPRASVQGYDARVSSEEKTVYFRLLFTPEAIGEQFIATISYRGKNVAATSFMVNNIYMEDSVAIPAKDFHAWSPAHPCLYDLEMTLARNGEVSDKVLSYLGANEIAQKKNYLTLNGKKRYLKFVLYQGYNPAGGLTNTEEGYQKDIDLIRSMGFNGVRVHEKVESELFYYLADKAGLLTDVELPSPHAYTPQEAEEASDQFGRIVTDHVGHPSLIAYVGYNESWGIDEIQVDEEQQRVATSLYAMANRIDWTRPAISNDGYEMTETDVLALHNYAENGSDLLAQYNGFKNKLLGDGNLFACKGKMAFVGNYRYSGQPCILSEFFGASFQKDVGKGWGYGPAVATPRGYIRRYRSLLRAIKKLGFVGYCATQFADTYQEKNGFVDDKRVPKVAIDSVARANKAF